MQENKIQAQIQELQQIFNQPQSLNNLGDKFAKLIQLKEWKLAQGNSAISPYPYFHEMQGLKQDEYISHGDKINPEYYSYGFEQGNFVILIPPFKSGRGLIQILDYQAGYHDHFTLDCPLNMDNPNLSLDLNEVEIISIQRDLWLTPEQRAIIQIGKYIRQPIIKIFEYHGGKVVKSIESREREGVYKAVTFEYLYLNNQLSKIIMPEYNNYVVFKNKA